MEPFLKRVADHLTAKAGKELGNMCVVLPNRRAGLFLQKYLADRFSVPVWLPEILSVEDFIFKLARLEKADKLSLLLEFHRQYNAGTSEEPTPLRQFLYWADPLLDDFNDLDFALADASEVFAYLSEIKAIEMWSPASGALSPLQQDYLHFYQSLGGLYAQLRQAVLSRQSAWPGLAASVLLASLQKEEVALPWKTICFAGLNAITPAEQKIIASLQQQCDTVLLWDADHFYTQNKDHEAGLFLRKNKKAFPGSFLWEENQLAQSDAQIQIQGVPGKVAQAKLAGKILHQWMDEGYYPGEGTAVVLADESLLLPALNAIPAEIKDINVTMGFPMTHSPAYRFFLAWLKLMEDRERMSLLRGQKLADYRIRLLLPVVTHPWFQYLDASEESGADHLGEHLLMNLQKAGSFSVPANTLQNFCLKHYGAHIPWPEIFPEAMPDAVQCTAAMVLLVDALRQGMGEKADKAAFTLDTEYLYLIHKQLNQLSDYMDKGSVPEDVLTLRLLFERMLSGTQLPLSGEPLRGLQVMGMLETRALDFERVILLSVNEDILPAGKFQQTFLPLEIRNRYHLPSGRERTAVAAYHFYRLLHHPSQVHILYNTEVGSFGGGEKSRFIHQLLFELQNKEGIIPPPPKESGLIPEALPASALTFEKEDWVMTRLDALAERGLSPSALSTYRRCPLQFYLSRIARLKPEQEEAQEGSSRELGDLLHLALEYLYTPWLGKPLGKEAYRQMNQDARKTLEEAFKIAFPARTLSGGKSLLLFEQALLMLKGFLHSEAQWLSDGSEDKQLVISALEKEAAIIYSFTNKEGTEKAIQIKGKADRIDFLSGQKRIVDYKSGNVRSTGLKLDDPSALADSKYDQAFQLMTYDLIFSSGGAQVHQLCILALKAMKDGPITLKFKGSQNIGSEQRSEYRQYLDSLLAEIFDPTIPFGQTEEIAHCTYCDFKDLCYR